MSLETQLYVLVPGIAGSKIYCNCSPVQMDEENQKMTRLYPRRMWFFNSAIHRHLNECPNVRTKILKTFWHMSVYSKFMKKITACPLSTLKVFPYDWRQDPIELAKNLMAFLQTLNLDTYSRIKLIGHSMGGFLIRIMMEYLDPTALGIYNLDRISVFQCGTPMYGSENINDYNYGFELSALLASSGLFYSCCPNQKIDKRSVNKIKPFLFSVSDLKSIIDHACHTLLYLLPTPVIKSIFNLMAVGRLEMREYGHFDLIYSLHTKLNALRFPVHYTFFYNIGEHRIESVYVPFCTSDILANVSVHDIKPGNQKQTIECGIYLRRLMKSDGLVVPYSGRKIPHNCSIYVDESEKCSHSRLMNSRQLWRIVRNSSGVGYFNQTSSYIGNDLPSYDDIFSDITNIDYS